MIADFSKYQGNVDWNKAAPKLDFAILRASCGTSKDTKYDEYASELLKRKKPFHAYHYLKATTVDSAKKEALIFSQATSNFRPLFYVIDAEYQMIRASQAKTLIDTFEQELRRLSGPSIKVAIYIAHNLYKSWNLNYSKYAYVWIPRYGKNTGTPDKMPDYPCDLWQYTSKGKLEGVNGNVDLNKLSGEKLLSYFVGEPVASVSGPQVSLGHIEIVNGNCYVRTAPSVITGKKLGVAKKGSKLTYLGQTSDKGWHSVEYYGKTGWVSGKYSKLCL